MSKLNLHPRLVALLTLVGGSLIVTAIVAIGGMTAGGRGGGKAIFLVGIAGIAAGVGLTQLLWPPKVPAEGDERSGWQRASVGQKMLWILGGCIGVVGAAVTQVVMTGNV